jgi:hypothetical protein
MVVRIDEKTICDTPALGTGFRVIGTWYANSHYLIFAQGYNLILFPEEKRVYRPDKS